MVGSSPAMTSTVIHTRLCGLTRFARLVRPVAEQRSKLLLAGAGKIHHAAAGCGIARSPFQLGETVHHGGAQGAGEMVASFAPVEARLAHRAARMGEHVGRDLQMLGEKTLALRRQL